MRSPTANVPRRQYRRITERKLISTLQHQDSDLNEEIRQLRAEVAIYREMITQMNNARRAA